MNGLCGEIALRNYHYYYYLAAQCIMADSTISTILKNKETIKAAVVALRE